MTIDKKNKSENNINKNNRETVKTPVLLSRKIDKYEYPLVKVKK